MLVDEPASRRWVVERLHQSHDRTAFDCGYVVLNEWLKQRATQWDKKDLARTYVAVERGAQSVVGYYSLSNHRVIYDALPAEQAKGIPTIDVPVVLLGRLAVDKAVQGLGLGEFLLIDALRRVCHVADHVGVRAIEVDAVDEIARNFYLKYGFVSLLDDQRHLFLPIVVVRKLKLLPNRSAD